MLNLPPKPFPVIQKFLHENKLTVYKYLVKQVRKGIREDLEKVELFQINPVHSHQKHTAIVKQKDYEIVLQDAMQYAIKEEDYEDDTSPLILESFKNNIEITTFDHV